MTRSTPSVTCSDEQSTRLPDWAAQGVTLVLDLQRRAQLEPLTDRTRIRREGGFAGFDILLFFLYFFASGLPKGVRTYWEDDARLFGSRLAAVGGRKQLASPASLSRALSAVEFKDTRSLGPWLLREVAGTEEVMRHPAALTWDALAQPWHVFDFDPTVHTLRQRALPDGDDLPKVRRRALRTAAPGYSGRKRGDVQLRRATLQHTGCSMWLDEQMAPGNGCDRAELGHALDVVAETVDSLDAPRERALFRADGAFGHVPGITAARERGLAFLSRLTRPKLLDQPEVRQRLAEATWLYVPDSRSGPRRSAIDLGMVTLTAGKDVMREDGSPYVPVEVRVVVSRYPCDEESTRGRGPVLNGWRYELFVADGLVADAWPAQEVVAQYYGRTAEENRFHQEDIELNLDRIFSYHLPGQEFATLVGLFVWNLRVARGFELAPPPAPTRSLAPQEAEVDLRLVTANPLKDAVARTEASVEVKAMGDPPVAPTATPLPTGEHALERALSVVLDTFDWERLLAGRAAWSRPPGSTGLLCPHSQPLPLTCAKTKTPARCRLQFKGAPGACGDCASMASCFPTARSTSAKLTSVTVSAEQGARVREALGPVQQLRRGTPSPPKGGAPKRVQHKPPNGPVRVALAMRQPVPELAPGPHAVVDPLLLPAAARRVFRRATRHMDIYVTVNLPDAPLPFPRLLARSKADRQHRRCTWDQHRDRYALPPDARVSIRMDGGSALSEIVGSLDRRPFRAAG
ncbi:MAG: hypothetical protein O2816_18305 [Planctomycetota bacterium]|nr:hypothetical protein [Planctomycetota bacterium]